LVPVFSYGNHYATTSRINGFARTKPTSAAAAQLVAAVIRPLAESSPEVALQHVLKLYAAFQPAADGSGWRSVQAVCEALPHIACSFDMRALVHVGLLNGLIRAVRIVPVRVDAGPAPPRPTTRPVQAAMIEGHHDLSSVCCELSATVPEAKRKLLAACGGLCAWVSQ